MHHQYQRVRPLFRKGPCDFANTSGNPNAFVFSSESFPFGLQGSASDSTQFVSGGVVATSGLALGIHDGVGQKEQPGQGFNYNVVAQMRSHMIMVILLVI